tara:strand:- start:590 stop:1240 length:651 start_codon:yes stop_codon:yes gene_type:complete
MDIISRFAALLLLLILSPLFLLLSLVLLIFQGYPIIFYQKRVGYNFKIFNIYKFRSMKINSGSLLTKDDDNRITLIGKIIRSTKLDEIPQLINILYGDMRFIGPRPEVIEFFDKKKFKFLEKIKPGISDYSSILFRNESKVLNKIGGKNPYEALLPYKLALAYYYAKRKSFFLDFKLVILTIISIFFPKTVVNTFIGPELYKRIDGLKDFCIKYIL